MKRVAFVLGFVGTAVLAGIAPANAQSIVAADPPCDNPYLPGYQPYRSVASPPALSDSALDEAAALQTQAGIVTVTFSGPPAPTLLPAAMTVACTPLGSVNVPLDCPSVESVLPLSATVYQLVLSGPIPPGGQLSLTFAGISDVLVYESLPGDIDFGGCVGAADLTAFEEAFAAGTANDTSNLARFDVDLSGEVTADDFVRLQELRYGVDTTTAWGLAAPCFDDASAASELESAADGGNWTPPAWQGAINWCRDQQPKNKIDDLIDASSEVLFDIVVNYREGVTAADLTMLEPFSHAEDGVHRFRYLSSVMVDQVDKDGIAEIAALEQVAFIEGQWGFADDLDTSVPALCVTVDPDAAPPAPAGGCGGAVRKTYPWLLGNGVRIAIMDSGVDDPGGPNCPLYCACGTGAGTVCGVDNCGAPGLCCPGCSGCPSEVYLNHVAFPAASFSYDVVTHQFCNPDGVTNHGTAVAGVALGRTGSGYGLEGVAPAADLVDVRRHAGGTGDDCQVAPYQNAVEALDILIAAQVAWNIAVVNMSFGQFAMVNGICMPVGQDGLDGYSQMVDFAVSKGMMVVATQGNQVSQPARTPGAATRAITVSQIDNMDTPARNDDIIVVTSGIGPRASDGDLDIIDELKPDLAAIGANIEIARFNSANLSIFLQGTSFAAPQVTGLVALLRQGRPGINAASIRQALVSTAEPRCGSCACLPALGCCQNQIYPGWDCRYGWGYADGFAAISAALSLVTDVTFPNYPPDPAWLSPDVSVPFPIQQGVQTTVTVQVRNVSPTATAQKVRVHFGVGDFSASPTLFDDFGTVIVDLPPGITSVAMPWSPRADDHKDFQIEIGYGADRNHANNLVRRSFDIAAWSASNMNFTSNFRVANTAKDGPSLITLTPSFATPGTGWVASLVPPSVTLDDSDPPANIVVTITPPSQTPGLTNTLHIGAQIGTTKLGGVSIQATVPP